MRTYQEFITEIRRFRLRRSGGDPFTRYSDGKQKPLDLSAIHAAGNADAKASVGYKEKRLKQYRRQETARRMDAAGKKLGLPEENVQELFITKLTPEQKRKKKVETLIRLMKHAKDPSADVAKTKKEDYVSEMGDWWHSDPKKDRAISGVGNKMRAREDRGDDVSIQKKPDYSNKLKPGETYMQFAKRKEAEKIKKEDYELGEAIRNPESRKKLRDIEDREVRKGDKSKGENPRSKYPTEKGKLAGHLLRGPESTGSKGNPVRSRGGTNAPADERVGKGPHRAGNAAYWASVAGPTRDRGAGNNAARRAGKSVPNTRDDD